MEDQNPQKKGISIFFPILLIVVLFAADLVLAYAVLNPDKLWKSKYFPVNPAGENIFSYGIMQQLDLEVIDIQDFEDHNGDTGKQFLFQLEDETGETKTLEKYVIAQDGNLEEFYKILLFWDPASNSWVAYDDVPDTVDAEIKIGDKVTVNYNSYYEKGVHDISIKIQTVEHRPELNQQIPNEQ